VQWSVSDASIASVEANGRLTGKKAGLVTIKGAIEDREATATVQVVTTLPTKQFLPRLCTEGTISSPNEVKLAFGKDRVIKFHAGFDNPQDDVTVDQKALDQKLPWSFSYPGGTVELTGAASRQVTGEVRNNRGGKVAFSVWSDDEGAYPISLQGKTFILVGDSMAEGLAWTLRGKVKDAGGNFFSEPTYSSTTISWQADRRMTELVERYKPDIIFIALGSNEVIVPNVGSRASAVKQITEEMGDRPCYWIGPPSWRPDLGIVHVIEENFRPGRFYNSNDLKVPRRKDGAHPTPDGFKTWADLVWDWYGKIG
jgi:lysophospholipase L1-like esterase